MTKMSKFEQYTFDIALLSDEEGRGFLLTWSDLPGCMFDGESIENGRDVFQMWVETHIEQGRPISKPDSCSASGRFVQRLPKSLHSRLAAFAKSEGVNINTLVATMTAESLGEKAAFQ